MLFSFSSSAEDRQKWLLVKDSPHVIRQIEFGRNGSVEMRSTKTHIKALLSCHSLSSASNPTMTHFTHLMPLFAFTLALVILAVPPSQGAKGGHPVGHPHHPHHPHPSPHPHHPSGFFDTTCHEVPFTPAGLARLKPIKATNLGTFRCSDLSAIITAFFKDQCGHEEIYQFIEQAAHNGKLFALKPPATSNVSHSHWGECKDAKNDIAFTKSIQSR
jgi:hypothetical protein